MKTIAICTFLSFVALLAVGVLGLQWLDAKFGQVAVIVMVAFVAVALFVIVIMALLSVFSLAQSRIYANTIRDTADVNLANARNVGKMLSASRGGGSREPELPMIDAQWWDAGAPAQLPEPQGRLAAIGGAVRRLLPRSNETPMDHALPLQRRNRRQPATQDWGDDAQEYDDRLIVS